MPDTIFQRYRKKAEKANIPANTQQSLDWFRNVARKTRTRFDIVQKGGRKGRPDAGDMIVYQYDPKHKAKLPYYDQYPLVIYCEPFRGGFYGFNLHYLSPVLRSKVLGAIRERGPKMILALSKVPVMRHAIKKYLNGHLVSKPVIIDEDDWEIAISLPFEGFQKAGNKEVWRASGRGRNV